MSGHSDYIRGSMPIVGQDKTFMGFIKASAFFTAFLTVVLLMPILVFGAGMTWLPALIVTFIIGLILAPIFKLGGAWYGTLVGLAIVGGVVSMIISALAG